RLRGFGVGDPRVGLARTLAARRRFRAGLLGTRLDQAHGLLERDLVRVLVIRDGGVDAVVGHVGPVAPLLDQDRRATLRMVTERAARIGAEAAALAGIGAFLGNQRDRAVEPDGEHVLARVEVGVGLAVLHVGAVAADAGQDRFAVLRALADLA